jgi:hypothetical protein
MRGRRRETVACVGNDASIAAAVLRDGRNRKTASGNADSRSAASVRPGREQR